MSSSRSGAGTTTQFVLLAAVWGASFYLVKVSLRGLQPFGVVLGRITLGAAALLVISAARRSRPDLRPRVLAHLVVLGFLLCDLPFALIAWAEQRVTSSEASLYNAATPLAASVVTALLLRHERLGASRLAGIGLGAVGVVVVIGPWRHGFGSRELLAQLACLAAASCYGSGFVYLRRFLTPFGLSGLALATGQITAAAAIAWLAVPFARVSPVHLSIAVVLAIVALGAAGTGVAYIWNANVIGAWGAAAGSTVTYLLPVVGVVLGVAANGEHLSAYEPIGAALILAGVALSNGTRRRAAGPTTPLAAPSPAAAPAGTAVAAVTVGSEGRPARAGAARWTRSVRAPLATATPPWRRGRRREPPSSPGSGSG